MSKKPSPQKSLKIEEIAKAIELISEQTGKEIFKVSLRDLPDFGVSERQIRNNGGLALIKNKFFPESGKNLSVIAKTKKDNSKICKCGLKFKLINRNVKLLNEYEYTVTSDYKCDCGGTYSIENLKLINISTCENCGEPFVSTGSLQLESSNKNLTFNLICSCCGHARKFREIEYTKEELQELQYNEALKGDKWEHVKAILKAECKKAGYHHRYALRLMDSLQIRCSKPNEAIDKIKTILRQNKKISALMYI
jgi:RNase P subunit RPR2